MLKEGLYTRFPKPDMAIACTRIRNFLRVSSAILKAHSSRV